MAMSPDWSQAQYVGELGVDAATCAFWDEATLPRSTQIADERELPTPPAAVSLVIGDDIDGAIDVVNVEEEVIGCRVWFVDDFDQIDEPWVGVGGLGVPSGALVIADPFCAPVVPYRQVLSVRPGLWAVEALWWEGDLEAVRLWWSEPL